MNWKKICLTIVSLAALLALVKCLRPRNGGKCHMQNFIEIYGPEDDEADCEQ